MGKLEILQTSRQVHRMQTQAISHRQHLVDVNETRNELRERNYLCIIRKDSQPCTYLNLKLKLLQIFNCFVQHRGLVSLLHLHETEEQKLKKGEDIKTK